MRSGHECVVHDLEAEKVTRLEGEGARGARDLDALRAQLAPPRVVWVMVPAGDATTKTMGALAERLDEGDIVVDGGNTHYTDDDHHRDVLGARGIGFLDAGTSGGVHGLEEGYCLMVGGPREHFDHVEPLLRALSPGGARGEGGNGTATMGYVHTGRSGSGHFVKMVHNGIEYAAMQAYAEGFDLLRAASDEERPPERRFDLDLAAIAEVWRHGSVVRSWLLDLTAEAFAGDPELSRYEGRVGDSGEGRWALQTAVQEAVSAPALAAALFARFRSRRDVGFGNKVLSAMRHGFGGHDEPKAES
jgi:6-phosphogluconate dehydrogenase